MLGRNRFLLLLLAGGVTLAIISLSLQFRECANVSSMLKGKLSPRVLHCHSVNVRSAAGGLSSLCGSHLLGGGHCPVLWDEFQGMAFSRLPLAHRWRNIRRGRSLRFLLGSSASHIRSREQNQGSKWDQNLQANGNHLDLCRREAEPVQ